ncbi:unnamed protein product [Protopolystoma xenopodis]|uniref:Peptidase M14 carboxypeptidase A domain-containing protein n=1 Tax=Protopolystoma xenopodis TaxID=117903 RepID=A0A3S5CBP4_9PLAT|nr:unnamed protein product [Protopolystoma xenopodis]
MTDSFPSDLSAFTIEPAGLGSWLFYRPCLQPEDRLLQTHKVVMYCDLHGHSRRQNMFVYGCKSRRSEDRLLERVFPAMLGKNMPGLESFCYLATYEGPNRFYAICLCGWLLLQSLKIIEGLTSFSQLGRIVRDS